MTNKTHPSPRPAATPRPLWADLAADRPARALLVELDATALRVVELVERPPWGLRLHRRHEFDRWGEIVAGVCAPFAQPRAAGRLLANGWLVEGERRAGPGDLADSLRAFATTLGAAGGALLRVGRPAAAVYYQLLADALGAELLLVARHDRSLPPDDALNQELRGQPLALPWAIDLLVADPDGARLLPVAVELIAAGGAPAASEKGNLAFSGAPLMLYTGPGQRAAELYVQRIVGDRIETVEVISLDVAPDASFTVCGVIPEPEAQPALEIAGATVRARRPGPQPPPALPAILTTAPPIDLAFILDGTLAADDFAAAVRGIDHIAAAFAAESNTDVRLSCLVYGEYAHQFTTGQRWRSDLECEVVSFKKPNYFRRSLRTLRPLTPFKHDFSDALELALQRLNHDLRWLERSGDLYVILIGHSPPHPTGQERQSWQLNVWTTDEFHRIDWRAELAELRAGEGVYTLSVWVGLPVIANSRREWVFAADVWAEVGDIYRRDGFGSAEEYEALLEFLRDRRPATQRLAGPLPIPLAGPLPNVLAPLDVPGRPRAGKR